MADPWTLAELNTQLSGWKDALLAVSTGQSYSWAGRTLTRVDAGEIRDTIAYLSRQIQMKTAADAGGRGDGLRIAVVP